MTRLSLACALVLLSPALVSAQSREEILRDCELADFLELEVGPLYACADGRYIETSADEEGRLTVTATGRLPRGFRRFVEDGERVLVELEERSRVPLQELRAGQARVAAVDGRSVVLDGEYFDDGERVALVAPDRRMREEVVAVGRARTEGRATVIDVGVGEVVPVHAAARSTDLALTADPWAPPRHGNIWQIALTARAFVGVNDFPSIGFLGGIALRYRAKFPMVLTTELDPVGVDAQLFTMTGVTMLGFDLPMIEVAVGPAFATDNSGRCCGTFVFALAQRVRIGALDGLHAEATMVEGVGGQTLLVHSLIVRAQLPLEPLGVRDTWIVARGGGGVAGFGLGEIGVRSLLTGGGWRGSIFVTVVGGALGMFRDMSGFPSLVRAGPVLGVDFEARF